MRFGRDRVPVVAITGFGRREDVDRAREAGLFASDKASGFGRLAKALKDVSNSKFKELAFES